MKTLKSIFSKAGIYCMLMTVIYTTILFIMEQGEYASITLLQYTSLVIFSLLLACASLLFSIKTMPGVAVWVIHYLACAVAFFAVFTLFGNIKIQNPGQILFLFLGFSMLYGVIMGGKTLVAFLLSRYLENDKKKVKKPEEYTPLYKQ